MIATPITNTFFTTRPYLSTSDLAALKLDATNELCIRVGCVGGEQGLFVQVRARVTAPKAKRTRKAKVTGTVSHEQH